jgi:signal transduction histidine kinase
MIGRSGGPAGVVLACSLLAAGCVAIGPDVREASETDAIVATTVAAARLPAEARKHELARAQQEFERLADDANRLRLAALLATLPAPERDDARAASLLAPLAARSPETPRARLAALLAAQVAERQRIARAGVRREGALRNQIEALKSIEHGVLEREERLRTGAR